MSVSARARGRWPEIISRLLGEQFLSRKHGPCPVRGDGVDRYRFSDHEGTGNFFCACNDGSSDGIALIRCATGCDYKQAVEMVEEIIGKEDLPPPAPKKIEWWEKIKPQRVAQSAYLKSRGLEMAPALRFAREVPYFEDGKLVRTFDGMFAPIMRGEQFVTWHLTYLFQGRKANVSAPRKVLSNGIKGASIPLYPFSGAELGVAEGIETAIAAHLLYKIPVWSAINASNLAAFEWPDGVTTLQIFADRDANYAGVAAAYTLAHRAMKMKVDAVVYLPKAEGDFNDELLREASCSASE